MAKSFTMMHQWVDKQIPLFSKFAIVGIVAAIVDIVLFNLISIFLDFSPIAVKVISGVISTLLAWVGNRYWTFRKDKRENKTKEVIEYLLVALAGLLIALTCLGISHYALGLRSLIADNISGNVVGLILATLFRYFANQYWVFNSSRNHK